MSYPLNTSMLAGIRANLLISTPQDIGSFQHLLGDGSQVGLALSDAEQPRPAELAPAMQMGRTFVAARCVALVWGHNLLSERG